jgi:hypothetical protein
MHFRGIGPNGHILVRKNGRFHFSLGVAEAYSRIAQQGPFRHGGSISSTDFDTQDRPQAVPRDRGRGDVAIVTLAPRAKNGVGVINTGGIADSPLQDHRLRLRR